MDNRGNIIEIIEYNGDENYSTTYEYDRLNNLVKITDNEGNEFNFSYDSLGRKISEYDPDLGLIESGYDANGNLIWEKRMHGGLVSDEEFYRQYNELGQLVNISLINGTLIEEYTYDPNGARIKTFNNLTDTTTYTPFKEFMMIVNDSGTFNYTYIYDGDDKLVARINPDGSKYFYHPDHLGSTSLITNETGDVVEDNYYMPYGLPMTDSAEIKLYENKEYSPELDQYYYGFRYYSPSMRLFLKADSILPNVYDPQQLNRYAFERGNPYAYVDEDGHWAVKIDIGSSFAGINVIYEKSGGVAIAIDPQTTNAQIGLVESTSKGIGRGIGISAGPSLTIYPSANNLQDISGKTKSVGGTIAVGKLGVTTDISKNSFSLGFTPGAEAEVHFSESITNTVQLEEFSLKNLFGNIISSAKELFKKEGEK